MDGGPPSDRFRPPDPVTMLNQQNLQPSIDESSSDSSYNSSQSQIHGTRANEKISQSHEVQDGQKSSEFPIPISRNQPVTEARSVGESPQRRPQDCNIQEVIRPEFSIGDRNTDRAGHPTEVSSSFHGGNVGREASCDSTGIPAMDSGKLFSADERRLFAQQKNPHRDVNNMSKIWVNLAPLMWKISTRNRARNQTQLTGGVKIAHFNSRHVYNDLDNELDYNMVWTKQRMNISGKVMRIHVWTPSFKPAKETHIVLIWIFLLELPWHCYNKEFVTGLLSPIGNVLYLVTASIKKTRGSQARVKVQVDLSQKRPPYIWMGYIGEDITDGRWQKIEYDNIPDYCFYCKHKGHVENDCTIRQKDEEKKKKEMDNMRNKSNKDMDINQQQPKGYKDSGPNDDNTNHYNQQKDQGQKQGKQEDQWHTQRRRNNNQQQVTRGNTIQPDQSTKQTGIMAIPTQNTYINLDVHESPPPLEELAIHKGSKQDSRLQPALKHQQEQGEQITNVTKNIAGKEVSKGQDVTGINSMLPPLKPRETIVVEDSVGGMDGREQEKLTNLQEGVSKRRET
ncbi:hypothetical protein KY285_030421 [Solanum tuberosum]|nr:hypothetical protein KY285_030421 [Solanum tuberosum]